MPSAIQDAMQKMADEVTRNKTVTDSVLGVVTNLAATIEANKNDPTALQALADSLRANDDAVAAAVSANTTPAPGPVATEPPVIVDPGTGGGTGTGTTDPGTSGTGGGTPAARR